MSQKNKKNKKNHFKFRNILGSPSLASQCFGHFLLSNVAKPAVLLWVVFQVCGLK